MSKRITYWAPCPNCFPEPCGGHDPTWSVPAGSVAMAPIVDVERETAERIALEAEAIGKSYDANAVDSTDWYVKAAKLLRDFAADIRAGAWRKP